MDKKEKDQKEIKEKYIKVSTLIGGALAVLATYFLIVGILIYFFRIDNAVTRKTADFFPYPAAVVGDKIVTIGELQKRVDAARRFYENQDFSDAGVRIDFSTPDGKKRLEIKEKNILNKMIEDEVIEGEANKRGIKLNAANVSDEVTKAASQYGDANSLKDNVEKLYNWTIEDFENNVVKPDLYQQKLYENFRSTEDGFKTAEDKINKAKQELDSGHDFEAVVAKYSEGDSVKNRGDLGWFTADQMLPEISQVVFNMDKNQTSDIIESSLGYHIIQVLDKKTENNQDKVHVRQIFVRIPSFPDWLAEREKETRIYIPMRDFLWNSSNQSVEFKDSSMQQLEQKVKANPNGDVSVLF